MYSISFKVSDLLKWQLDLFQRNHLLTETGFANMVKVALTLVSLVSLIKPGLLVEPWHSHGTGGESCYVYMAAILLPKPCSAFFVYE